jgi:hypothetical protein
MGKKIIKCSCIGQTLQPSGQDWSDEVESSKLVGKQLLLYFKNKNFTCDNRTCFHPKEK